MTARLLARPTLVTPGVLARQFVRLADWHVQTRDPDAAATDPALTAGHRLAGPALAGVFDALCDVTERMIEIETNWYEFGPFEDPDAVDRDAIEAHTDALTALVFSAATRALSGGAR